MQSFSCRLSLVPRGYILLVRTNHPGNKTKKPINYAVNAGKTLSILERILTFILTIEDRHKIEEVSL